MILAPLVSVALVVSAATSPMSNPQGSVEPSVREKNAAMQPLVRSATECIARTVVTDARFRAPETALAELIVESMPFCLGPVRAMIDAYDRYFGDGAGEAFFMGPYLDVLPAAVNRWATERSE
jgi:hypothetical protein